MSKVLSAVFPTLEAAEAARDGLVARKIPGFAMDIQELGGSALEVEPGDRISLGAGVPLDAIDMLVEQHEGEETGITEGAGFLLTVTMPEHASDEIMVQQFLDNASSPATLI